MTLVTLGIVFVLLCVILYLLSWVVNSIKLEPELRRVMRVVLMVIWILTSFVLLFQIFLIV